MLCYSCGSVVCDEDAAALNYLTQQPQSGDKFQCVTV